MNLTTDDLLFIGMKGHALAFNRHTGEEVWRTALKGSGFVNIVLDQRELFAGSRGELFCLDPCTGQVRWHNPLKGMGFNLITFASGNAQAALQAEREEEARQAAETSAAT